MKRLAIGLFATLLVSGAYAQRVVPPADTANCAFNTSPPTIASGNMIRIQCDAQGRLLLSPTGSGIIVSGNVSNASSGVAATATNVPTVGYNYVWNGATWDQATGLVVGTAGTPSTQVVSVQGIAGATSIPVSTSDPCTSASKSSAAISVTSGTTTSLVAVSGSTTVYVCGFAITIAPSAVTAATALFEYGTGATCTSPTVLTGTFGNGDLTSAAGVAPILYGNGSATVFKSVASAGICILTAGNAVSVQGVLTYVQQ